MGMKSTLMFDEGLEWVVFDVLCDKMDLGI